ncbi:MAG: hypothetical protein J5828_05955 [Desulfovibrionaceae bacterium]|nr:hypothetical protein [Desulfovibrionaceae bacterium]
MSQGTLAAGCGIVNGARARRAGAGRLTAEERKIRIGFALIALQLALLAATFGFRAACDRQMERDGVSIQELLGKQG